MVAKKQSTFYLDADLKRALEVEAAHRGQTEASILRDALREYLQRRVQPPIMAIGSSNDGGVARDVRGALGKLRFGEE